MSNIRILRKKFHLTQSKLAEKLGVTQTSVSQWESGRNYPDIKTARKMAQMFNVSLDQILESRDDILPTFSTSVPTRISHDGAGMQNSYNFHEMRRQLVAIFDNLSSVSQIRLLERAETYLEMESVYPVRREEPHVSVMQVPTDLPEEDDDADNLPG